LLTYNHIIANCPESVPVKNCENWSIIGEDMKKISVTFFYDPRCIYAQIRNKYREH